MKAISTANHFEIKQAIAEGFNIRVEIGIAGHLVHTVAFFCASIQEARQAFKANKHKGNMVQVVEHFSKDDFGHNKEIYCGWI